MCVVCTDVKIYKNNGLKAQTVALKFKYPLFRFTDTYYVRFTKISSYWAFKIINKRVFKN